MKRIELSPEVRDILTHLGRGGKYGYYWTSANGDGSKLSSWYETDRVPGFPEIWVENDWNIYFGINPTDAKKTNSERVLIGDVSAINAFFGEYDAKDFGDKESIIDHLHNLKNNGIPYPTVIVDSGGGYHCYWLLDNPVLVDESNRHSVKCQLYAWIDSVGSDQCSKDLCRVLRVPGTVNTKPHYAPDFPTVEVYELNWANVYTHDQLLQAIQYDPSFECVEPSPKPFTTNNIPVNGDRTRKYALAVLASECDTVANCLEGSRNDTLFKSAARVGEVVAMGGIAQGEAEETLLAAALQSGLPESEARKTMTSGMRHGFENPRQIKDRPFAPNHSRNVDSEGTGAAYRSGGRVAESTEDEEKIVVELDTEQIKKLNSFPSSDDGNAQAMDYLFGHKFLYNDSFGWLAFNGRAWIQDGAVASVERYATKTLEHRLLAAQRSDNLSPAKFASDRHKIVNMREQFRIRVYAQPDSFDKMPDYLNTKSGMVDLRTGELFQHDSSYRITYCVNTHYNPHADQSFWKQWLVETCGEEQADWLQLAVGYSLTGHTREEILFYIYGEPRSGKGTFTETILALLGTPLGKEIGFNTFTADRTGDSQNFDLAPLKSTRFVAASESEEHERLKGAKIKQMTGGNRIHCAFKRKDFFEYRPEFKIWLSSNYQPNADPDDTALWGRLRMINFPNSYLGKEDKGLKQRMLSPENLEAVLAWAIEGAIRWYALGDGGLKELATSTEIKNAQRSILDNVSAWLGECCVIKQGEFTSFTDSYVSYTDWCKKNGVEPKRQKGFSQSLSRKGYEAKVKNVRKATGFQSTRGFEGFVVV